MQLAAQTYSSFLPAVAVGAIATLGTLVGGTLYTTGTYSGVALTGGAGSGATANIVVAGGAVTSVAIVNPGSGYAIGNTLSASAATIGGTGSGFTINVASTVQTVNCRAIYCVAAGTITITQGGPGYYGPSVAIPMTTGQLLPIALDQGIISSLGSGSYLLLA